ncbi:MAG: hypothetical protein HOI95_09400, partial [Chromatiales bacterium]|nr:hypothetical protein [Chromatiales bacterium]
MNYRTLCLALVLALHTSPVGASNNIDLSTVPSRNSVQLTIYNSEDLTLVRERRLMSFKRGANQLQFSWANTLIDPTSVEIRFPGRGGLLTLVDTTFSHERHQSLVWNIESEAEAELDTEITYFTSGLTWSADYTVVANHDEKHADIDGFIKVRNSSGENYEGAEVRVVVGTINLVQKIAELARVPMGQVDALSERVRDSLRTRAAKRFMRAPAVERPAVPAMAMPAPDAPKEIIKEGLSEYFIYSIEGTETIADGWSKRLRSFDAKAVPLDVRYRFRAKEYGQQLVRMYLMRNDEASKLGTTPLPNGQVSVFHSTADGGLRYLTSQPIQYVPVGDRLELNLGRDPDVGFELKTLSAWRDEVWLKMRKP